MRIAAFLFAAAACAQPVHELCSSCHAEQVTDFQSHPHFAQKLSCDVCHGRSEKHIKAVGAAPPDRVAAPDEIPALCGACHSAEHRSYVPTSHAKLVLARARVKAPQCATCHGYHGQRAAKAQCSRCHMDLPQAQSTGHGNTAGR